MSFLGNRSSRGSCCLSCSKRSNEIRDGGYILEDTYYAIDNSSELFPSIIIAFESRCNVVYTTSHALDASPARKELFTYTLTSFPHILDDFCLLLPQLYLAVDSCSFFKRGGLEF